MALPTEPQHVFNSHPHKEDDDQLVPPVHSGGFSTHILTRRMTDGKREQESSSHFFNSHPHKEDDIFIITVFTLTSFSTHILTRRMTTPIPQVLVSHVFNSHPHKEDDNG